MNKKLCMFYYNISRFYKSKWSNKNDVKENTLIIVTILYGLNSFSAVMLFEIIQNKKYFKPDTMLLIISILFLYFFVKTQYKDVHKYIKKYNFPNLTEESLKISGRNTFYIIICSIVIFFIIGYIKYLTFI